MRQRVAQSGRDVVMELEPAAGNGAAGLGKLASGEGAAIDELVVVRVADAFSSMEQLLAALKTLAELGIDFDSLDEPWLARRSSAQPGPNGLDALPADLGRRAAQFLDLSIERMEGERRAAADQRRRAAIQSEVGGVLAQLLLLAPYAAAVAIVSQAVLNAALLDPDLLVRRLRDLVSGSTALSGAVNRAIPDALRGVVFSTISSLLLLAFRGTSIGLRAELGGTLFMGLVTLSVYGLSAGFGTGLVGALVAIPGLALAAVLIHEFTHMVLKVTAAAGAPAAAPPPRGALPGSPGRLLTSLEQWAHPTRSRALMVAFAAVPLFVVVASVGAAFTNGGWLFWPARIALFALAGWSAWACLATPGVVRIPLWSTLAWATVLLLLSAATAVTAVFAVVMVLLLAGSVLELVLRHGTEAVPSAHGI